LAPVAGSALRRLTYQRRPGQTAGVSRAGLLRRDAALHAGRIRPPAPSGWKLGPRPAGRLVATALAAVFL